MTNEETATKFKELSDLRSRQKKLVRWLTPAGSMSFPISQISSVVLPYTNKLHEITHPNNGVIDQVAAIEQLQQITAYQHSWLQSVYMALDDRSRRQMIDSFACIPEDQPDRCLFNWLKEQEFTADSRELRGDLQLATIAASKVTDETRKQAVVPYLHALCAASALFAGETREAEMVSRAQMTGAMAYLVWAPVSCFSPPNPFHATSPLNAQFKLGVHIAAILHADKKAGAPAI